MFLIFSLICISEYIYQIGSSIRNFLNFITKIVSDLEISEEIIYSKVVCIWKVVKRLQAITTSYSAVNCYTILCPLPKSHI